MAKERAQACPQCQHSKPSVSIRRGSSTIGTSYYHERIHCRHCHLEVSARTPGKAIRMWNGASQPEAA